MPNLWKLYEVLLSQELAVPIQKICSKKNAEKNTQRTKRQKDYERENAFRKLTLPKSFA